jgi:biotin carboxyl carrier protein
MKYKVTLNDRVYEVEVEQGQAMLLDEYALAAPAAPAAAPVTVIPAPAAAPAAPAAPAVQLAEGEVMKSPMPGNVMKILVTPGQQVKEGDVLLILEAMKMENEIVATKSGTVSQVVVNHGAVVETGSHLVVIA